MWVAAEKLPRSPGHPFYERLNRVLEKAGFDAFVEGLCARFYADGTGRPSLRPGRYFRMLLLGYFEGLNSERAIAWRVADSISVRAFLDLDPEETPPNHSTLSRTRRRIDVETHGEVFRWVLTQLAEAGLVRGKTIGIDATMLEANAAMRSLVRRDTGEDYERFVRGLAEASGFPTPTREELVRFDRKRKKKTTNQEWVNAHDPDAKITKLKDGRTRLSHKVEEAVDLETGAVTAPEELGDPQTMGGTLGMAQEEVKAVGSGAEVREVVADKGYHSNETVLELKELGLRGYLSETDRGRRNWKGKNRKYQAPVYANRRRIRGRRGRRLQRRRSELVERPFAHQFGTGGLHRIFVRGHANVRKRLLIHVCGFNLGLLLRHLTGVGTPRSLPGRGRTRLFTLLGARTGRWIGSGSVSGRRSGPIRCFGLLGSINKPSQHQRTERTLVGEIGFLPRAVKDTSR